MWASISRGHRTITGLLLLFLMSASSTPTADGRIGLAAQTVTGTAIEHRVLATRRTSTMQKELQDAADQGFHYRGQTVFSTRFGGKDVVAILERDKDAEPESFEYKLFATTKTSTLEKELQATGRGGYELVGMTVGKTAFGGKALVAITRAASVR